MATPIRFPDGTTRDIDDVTHMSDADKLELIQTILDRQEADDADKWEADPGFTLETIQKVLNITTPTD